MSRRFGEATLGFRRPCQATGPHPKRPQEWLLQKQRGQVALQRVSLPLPRVVEQPESDVVKVFVAVGREKRVTPRLHAPGDASAPLPTSLYVRSVRGWRSATGERGRPGRTRARAVSGWGFRVAVEVAPKGWQVPRA